jgi:hypothetical protein
MFQIVLSVSGRKKRAFNLNKKTEQLRQFKENNSHLFISRASSKQRLADRTSSSELMSPEAQSGAKNCPGGARTQVLLLLKVVH